MPDPKTTYSREAFVAAGEDTTIKYSSLSFNEVAGNTFFPILNVIDDYIDEFIAASREVDLAEDVKFKYKYRPKLLCEHLYGNGELYFIILLINGICNMKEFTLIGKVRLIERDKLFSIINQIYKSEKNQIEMHNEKETEDS